MRPRFTNADNAWKQRILDEMSAQDMSQRALAKRAGVGSTTIRHALVKADVLTHRAPMAGVLSLAISVWSGLQIAVLR